SASGSGCSDFPVAPALTIRNGVAQFAVLDLTYRGYVTPQGEVRMQTPEGRTFVGQIDPYYVLRGRTTGNCVMTQFGQGTAPLEEPCSDEHQDRHDLTKPDLKGH